MCKHLYTSAVAIFVTLAGVSVGATSGLATETAAPQFTGVVNSALDQRTAKITVKSPESEVTIPLTVSDTDAKSKLGLARPGDLITVNVDNGAKPQQLIKLVWLARPIPIIARLIWLAVSGMTLLLLAGVATGWNPLRFVIGVDNRYSNSQTQLALWFGTAAAVYLTALILRILYLGTNFVGGVDLTEHVMELTGLSALTFGGAKVITAQKVANAEAQALAPRKTKAARPNLVSDLVTNDSGQADLGDFQMILITILAALIFLVTDVAPTV